MGSREKIRPEGSRKDTTRGVVGVGNLGALYYNITWKILVVGW